MSTDDDLVLALRGVASAFDELQIPYFVGGSVASSYHGAMRSTRDVDIVAELGPDHVDDLLKRLAEDYYANRSTIEKSIESTSSFNLIHLPTSFKVDVFVSKRRAFDQSAMQRAQLATLGADDQRRGINVPVATTEDIIVAKLEWFRLGDESSERQWDDLTRLVSANLSKLNLTYLNKQAESIAVKDLLDRVIGGADQGF